MLPFLPPSKNKYDGWLPQWQSGAKRKWRDRIGWECRAQRLPLDCPRVELHAVLVFGSKNRRDPQNYASTLWNFVPDALVHAGVLVDDNEGRVIVGPQWGVEFAYDLRRGVPVAYRQRTILTIIPR